MNKILVKEATTKKSEHINWQLFKHQFQKKGLDFSGDGAFQSPWHSIMISQKHKCYFLIVRTAQ